MHTLKRDCGQHVAETARVGQLIMVAPDELQNTVLEHADRLQNYAHVTENMVMLLDSRRESARHRRRGRGIRWRK